jgi:N-acetylglucosamine-6-sulfatase
VKRSTRRTFIRNAGVAALAAPLAMAARQHDARGATGGRPNVLVMLVDDMPITALPQMAQVNPFFSEANGGLDLTEGCYGESALCAPSRTSLLTGMYPHNHGTFDNESAYIRYRNRGYAETDLLAGLDGAGYRVGFFGKFINNYDASPQYPGGDKWRHPHADRWSAIVGSQNDAQPWRANNDGKVTKQTGDHSPYFGSRAETFIRNASPGVPWFCMYCPTDPHVPYTPPPTYADDYDGARLVNPATQETDFSDKSSYWAKQTKESKATSQKHYEGTLEEGSQNDAWFYRLITALQQTDQLGNTIVVYVSDNGYLFGEHGGLTHKQKPYEPSIRVPLLIRGPGIPTRAQVGTAFGGATPLVSRLDLTPTILGFAGASTTLIKDGRDLRDLASGGWRSRILAEEPGGTVEQGWALVREQDKKLIRFDHENEFEYYDLASDPDGLYELNSLAKNPPPSVQLEIDALYKKLDALRHASGETLRTAEL